MNSLEAEYSFLAPTWKLPPVGTSSMYPAPRVAPDSSNWNNTMPNPRYVPPNANRRSYPQPNNQQNGGRSMQSQLPPPPPPPQPSNDHYRNNEYSDDNLDLNDYSNQQNDNRGVNYPQPVQKRVQIIDHNRRTPSTDYISERESQNSYSPNTHRKPKVYDNKTDSTHGSAQRTNNFNIHDYLYGLSAPDPGSYVSAYKNQRRRLEDEKVNRKSVITEYKTFVQNGGFGPAFGNNDHLTYEEKLDTEKKRKSYSKTVREVNQYKTEEHKRMQNNGGQQRNGTYIAPPIKHRRPDAMRSHFLSAQEVRDFERRIKREHAANCKCSLHANPHHSSA